MYFFLLFVFVLVLTPVEPKPDITSIAKSLLSLGDLGQSDEALDSKESRETRNYMKHLAKIEKKYYINKFRQERSQEEKDEVNYYHNLLKTVKNVISNHEYPAD